MLTMLKQISKLSIINKTKHTKFPILTPESQHKMGMTAVIQIRQLKRNIVIKAINDRQQIPILFDNLKYQITDNTPHKVKMYLFYRTLRSQWAKDLNKILELNYTYPLSKII